MRQKRKQEQELRSQNIKDKKPEVEEFCQRIIECETPEALDTCFDDCGCDFREDGDLEDMEPPYKEALFLQMVIGALLELDRKFCERNLNELDLQAKQSPDPEYDDGPNDQDYSQGHYKSMQQYINLLIDWLTICMLSYIYIK